MGRGSPSITLAGAKSWKKTREMGQVTQDLVDNTEELGAYPEGDREPSCLDLSRKVT